MTITQFINQIHQALQWTHAIDNKLSHVGDEHVGAVAGFVVHSCTGLWQINAPIPSGYKTVHRSISVPHFHAHIAQVIPKVPLPTPLHLQHSQQVEQRWASPSTSSHPSYTHSTRACAVFTRGPVVELHLHVFWSCPAISTCHKGTKNLKLRILRTSLSLMHTALLGPLPSGVLAGRQAANPGTAPVLCSSLSDFPPRFFLSAFLSLNSLKFLLHCGWFSDAP